MSEALIEMITNMVEQAISEDVSLSELRSVVHETYTLYDIVTSGEQE